MAAKEPPAPALVQPATGPATRATWDDLLEIARFAPSPHNGQAWRIALDDGRLDNDSLSHATLMYDPRGGLPTTDPGNGFTYAGMGCFIEILRRTALSKGWTLEYDVVPGDIDQSPDAPLQPIATFTLTPSIEVAVDEIPTIRSRQTSRARFNRKPVEARVLATCEEIARGFGQTFVATNDRRFVKWLVGLNTRTVFNDLRLETNRNELHHFVQPTNKIADKAGWGFSPKCLGIPAPVVRFFFKHHRISTNVVVEKALTAVYRFAGGGVRTVYWIRGPFDAKPLPGHAGQITHEDHINAGRALASIQLEFARHGLTTQPFGSVVTNPVSNAEFQGQIRERARAARITPDGDGKLWLAGRAGKNRRRHIPHSARRTVAEIFV